MYIITLDKSKPGIEPYLKALNLLERLADEQWTYCRKNGRYINAWRTMSVLLEDIESLRHSLALFIYQRHQYCLFCELFNTLIPDDENEQNEFDKLMFEYQKNISRSKNSFLEMLEHYAAIDTFVMDDYGPAMDLCHDFKELINELISYFELYE